MGSSNLHSSSSSTTAAPSSATTPEEKEAEIPSELVRSGNAAYPEINCFVTSVSEYAQVVVVNA
jgi:hypothetical protein